MSFNFAYGPVDIFQGIDFSQGLDFSNFMEHLAANNPYLDPNSEEYLAINPIQDSKPDQPIDEYAGILETPEMLSGTDGISGGYGIDNKPPIDERPNAPIGIPIEHLIAGITGEPIIAVDPEEAGGPNLPDSGIETLPTDNYADQNYVPPAANELQPENAQGPGQGITSLNNSMVFERMRALARQPRDYRSYIG